jgi:hypothetical protein
MFRLRDVIPDLDAGHSWLLIEDRDARLFLAELDASTGDVNLRPLHDPWRKVALDLPRSDELRWKFLEVLGKVGTPPGPFVPGAGPLPGRETGPSRQAGPDS